MTDSQASRPGPLLDAASLRSFIEQVRSRGERLVFTNGCFDLIHPGHVAYLTDARALGDRLLVGLNSDASVRKLKGAGRPLIPAEGRAEILSALRSVDGVAVFEDETPLRLIVLVRPDVLVKGGDYRPDQVVGASEVTSWGGRLEIVPFRGRYATSAIIRRIRNL